MSTLANKIAEIKETKRLKKPVEYAVSDAKERIRKAKARLKNAKRALRIIKSAPKRIENALLKDRRKVVIMSGIDASEVTFRFVDQNNYASVLATGFTVVTVMKWLRDTGIQTIRLEPEEDREEDAEYYGIHGIPATSERIHSQNRRYRLVVYFDRN